MGEANCIWQRASFKACVHSAPNLAMGSEAGGQVCGRLVVCVAVLVEAGICILSLKWYFRPVKDATLILLELCRILRAYIIYFLLATLFLV